MCLPMNYNILSNLNPLNDQNDVESDDELVALANLIANLKLDVNENKKIQKQLNKANTTLAQELKECKTILAETSKTLEESNSVRDSCLVALQNKQTEFEKYKAFNDHTVDYDKLEHSRNKNVDTTLRYKNNNQSGQSRNQRMMNECRKPKRVKDSTYHKEKMLLCKQVEKDIPLQAEQSDWLADTDKEIDEQELEAHYSYMGKIQEVPTVNSGTDSEPLEQ
nr:hypothetical protein [Tanacetum cinerariifolium]